MPPNQWLLMLLLFFLLNANVTVTPGFLYVLINFTKIMELMALMVMSIFVIIFRELYNGTVYWAFSVLSAVAGWRMSDLSLITKS